MSGSVGSEFKHPIYEKDKASAIQQSCWMDEELENLKSMQTECISKSRIHARQRRFFETRSMWLTFFILMVQFILGSSGVINFFSNIGSGASLSSLILGCFMICSGILTAIAKAAQWDVKAITCAIASERYASVNSSIKEALCSPTDRVHCQLVVQSSGMRIIEADSSALSFDDNLPSDASTNRTGEIGKSLRVTIDPESVSKKYQTYNTCTSVSP